MANVLCAQPVIPNLVEIDKLTSVDAIREVHDSEGTVALGCQQIKSLMEKGIDLSRGIALPLNN